MTATSFQRKVLVSVAAASLTAGLFTAIGCNDNSARVVEGNERVTTVGHIDIQDYENAAAAATQDMLSSDSLNGALPKAAHHPAVLAMSRIVNDTTQYIDTSLITKKIRIVLLNTGKMVTTTTFGRDAEDAKAKQTGAANEFFNDQQNKAPDLPDFTLSGKIIQVNARAGDTRQSTFVFQLSLTDTKTGYAIWEGEKEITKQGSHNSVGY